MKIPFFYTRLGVAIIVIAASLIMFATAGWNSSVLKGGDQWGYNAYLVSALINHDLGTLKKTYESKCKAYGIKVTPKGEKNRIDEAPDAPNGTPVLKYYYGVAAMQSPFFLVTHLLFGGNGYTDPYVFAISLSCVFYVVLGLLLMFTLLQKFVNKRTALFCLLLFFFGSNLFYFTLCNPGMSHPYLFFLFACLAKYTYDFYKKPAYRLAVLLGIICGLIVMTRAIEAVVLIIPLTFALQRFSHFASRISFIRQHCGKFLLAVFLFGLIILPQLFYWKATSGHWFYDSYPGEGFDFTKPHIPEGLFSFRNGWLVYTPLMILSLISLTALFRSRNPFSFGITAYLLITVYITYCWKQWNYNAGLGSRPMVESYALLLIPFAIFINSVLKQRVKWVFFLFLAFCVYINGLRIIQMQTGNFISEDATWQFNKQMLFKVTTQPNDIYAFDLNEPQPDTSKLVFVQHIGSQDFETATGNPKDSVQINHRSRSGSFTNNEYNDAMEVVINNQGKNYQYLRVSLWANVASYENHYKMAKVVVDLQRNGKPLLWKSVRLHNKLFRAGEKASLFVGAINQWEPITYYVSVDKPLISGDVLKVYAWNPSGVVFRVDDIMVDGFRKR